MKGKLKDTYRYTLAISPLDCMGCGVCIGVCPTNSLSMVGAEGELAEQDVFDYCVEKVADKPEVQDNSVKGSQFKQPLLEFSGACAGCAETSYARLVTQLFGDRMFISNATGLLLHLGWSCCDLAVYGQQGRSRPRLGELAVRGQRRARLRHAAGSYRRRARW